MSYFEDASLVYIPSAVKDAKTYSIKPTDGSGDFTFSRGSDIEATRVNSQGYIEKAQVNLLLQSNQFDTTWANVATTETGGQSGYDGTSDAWLLEKSSSYGYIYQNIIKTGINTTSVYAKAGSSNWMRLRVGSAPKNSRYFDLQNGVIGSGGTAPIDAEITSVGNGWYRCSITTDINIDVVMIYPAEGDDDISGTSGNIYIQDAQLNYGLVAQDYQETTTAAVVSGITNDMPRLSYDPANPTCPSLLLEPSRTNLLPYSEYAGGFGTSGTGDVTDNDQISPEGVQNAFTLNDTSDTGYFRIEDTASTTSGQKYTASVFIKKASAALTYWPAVQWDTSYKYCIFNNYTGTYSLASSGTDYESVSVEDFGTYWRLSLTGTAGSSSERFAIWPAISTDGTSISVGGTGSNTFYGAQVELGSYPSSYIPSYGSSATRTADLALKTSASAIIGQTEGTLFFEIDNANFDASNGAQLFSLDNGTNTDRIEIYAAGAGAAAGKIGVYVQRGSAQVAQTTSVNVQGHHKIALAYKLNDYALYIDGALQHSDTSALVPACNNVRLQGRYDNLMTGKHSNKQALLFTQRLSNSDLANLTTL